MDSVFEIGKMSKQHYLEILLRHNATKTSTIKCSRPGCNSTDIKVWEQQTRSSDEPISIFHKCRACGFVEINEG